MSDINTSKYINLYHISSDPQAVNSFSKRGACSEGNGFGGQATGFYCFRKSESAEKHIRFLGEMGVFDEKNQPTLITLHSKKEDLSYPKWQIDYEGSAESLKLLCKYREELEGKIFCFKDQTAFSKKCPGDIWSNRKLATAAELSIDHYFFFPELEERQKESFTKNAKIQCLESTHDKRLIRTESAKSITWGGASSVEMLQKMNDLILKTGYAAQNNQPLPYPHLDLDPEKCVAYLNEYNELIQTQIDRIKYVGNEPLRNLSIQKINYDYTTNTIKTPLSTSKNVLLYQTTKINKQI